MFSETDYFKKKKGGGECTHLYFECFYHDIIYSCCPHILFAVVADLVESLNQILQEDPQNERQEK